MKLHTFSLPSEKPAEAMPSVTSWLRRRIGVLRSDGAESADVPCGSCNACCRSGYVVERRDRKRGYVHDDDPTLPWVKGTGDHEGHDVLPHNDDGSCAMLVGGKCSVYAKRPYACRVYDCREMAYCNVGRSGPVGEVNIHRWAPIVFHGGIFKTSDDRAAFLTLAMHTCGLVEKGYTAEAAAHAAIHRTSKEGFAYGRGAMSDFNRLSSEQQDAMKGSLVAFAAGHDS